VQLDGITPATFADRFPRLVRDLEAPALETLVDSFKVHDADAGEALVAQGAQSDELFLVWNGSLDITVGAGGSSRRVAGLGPGASFGEVSLLDPGPAGANVVTEQGCTVLRLRRASFDELLDRDPQAAAAVLEEVVRSLAARLTGAATQVEAVPG
jgi:CRP-like cAMP-binding protein